MADGKITKDDLVDSGAIQVYANLKSEAVSTLKAIASAMNELTIARTKLTNTSEQNIALEKKKTEELKKAITALNKVKSAEAAYKQELLKELKAQDVVYKGIEKARKARLREADAMDRAKKSIDRQRQAQAKLDARLEKSKKSTRGLVGAFNSMGLSLKSVIASLGIISGMQMFTQLVKSTFDLTKVLNSMNFAMSAVIKSSTELGMTKNWLRDITDRFGAELVTTTNRYIKFRAAAIQANFTANETQKIFGTMTKAAGVLGLKTDELQGIYLALEQMISKGKVTTEELRRQLGERLPGAMDIMAKSMGVTTRELDAMMKRGEVLTKDVLPKFAEQVEKSFGIENVNMVDTLTASTIRLSNAWTALIQNLEGSEGGLSKFFKFFIDIPTRNLKRWDNLNTVLNSNLTLTRKLVGVWSTFNFWTNKHADDMATTITNQNNHNLLVDSAIDLIKKLNDGNLTFYETLAQGTFLSKLSTDVLNDYINALEKSLNVTEDSKDLEEGTVGWLRQKIKVNNDLIELSKDRTEIKKLQEGNAEYQRLINLLLGIGKAGEKAKKQLVDMFEGAKASLFGSIGYLQDLISENNKLILISKDTSVIEYYQEQNKAYSLLIDKMKVGLDLNQKLADTKGASFNIVGDRSGLDTFLIQFDNFTERYGGQIDQAIESTNMFFDNRIERLAQDRDANDEYYDRLIDAARGNQDEQDRLEAERLAKDDKLRKKQNETAKKQALFNKSLAIAEIAVNLARTISLHKATAAAMDAVSLGIAGTAYFAIEVPLSIGLAAAQTAAIIAAPVPKFKDGKDVNNFYEGLALVNDGGKTEYREDKFGNISAFKGTNVLTHVAKDDIIHKDIDSLASSKGYNMDDIYRATVMTSLASERQMNTWKLEKVFNDGLKDLDKKMTKGIRDGFRNVEFHSHNKVDINHALWAKSQEL